MWYDFLYNFVEFAQNMNVENYKKGDFMFGRKKKTTNETKNESAVSDTQNYSNSATDCGGKCKTSNTAN